MFCASLTVLACVCAGPPFANPGSGAVVLDVFPDGTLLISAGSAAEVEKGDWFHLARRPEGPLAKGDGT
jgi:hypothetical protein